MPSPWRSPIRSPSTGWPSGRRNSRRAASPSPPSRRWPTSRRGLEAMPTAEEIARLPYRPCVGMLLLNPAGKVFVGRRIESAKEADDIWQMPQGGIDDGETPRAAASGERGGGRGPEREGRGGGRHHG